MEATTTNSPDAGGPSGDVVAFNRRAADRPSVGAAIRVVLVDGEGLVRAGFRALLEAEADIRVVAEAADGEEAVRVARETRPDVVLMDIGLPGVDGLEATRRILADPALSRLKVLLLSAGDSDDRLFGALRAGASAYLVKDTEPVDLLRALRVVADGEALLSPSVTRRLIEVFASQPDPRRPTAEQLEELTAREREVLALVAMGLTNAEIAGRLVVSHATAKTHVSRAMVKLHARDRAKLVALAYETGFVQPPHQWTDAGAGAPSPAGAA